MTAVRVVVSDAHGCHGTLPRTSPPAATRPYGPPSSTGLVGLGPPVAGLLDVTGIRASAAALRAAFDAVAAPGTRILHASR